MDRDGRDRRHRRAAHQVPVRVPDPDRRGGRYQTPPSGSLIRPRARRTAGSAARAHLAGRRPRLAGAAHRAVPPLGVGAERRDAQPDRQVRRRGQYLPRPVDQRLQPVAQPVERAWEHQPVGLRRALLPTGDELQRRRRLPDRRQRRDVAARRPDPVRRRGGGGPVAGRAPRRHARHPALRAAAGRRLLRPADARPRALPLPGAGARRAIRGAARHAQLALDAALRRAEPVLLRQRVLDLHARLVIRGRPAAQPGRRRAGHGARPVPGIHPPDRLGHLSAGGDDRGRSALAHAPLVSAGAGGRRACRDRRAVAATQPAAAQPGATARHGRCSGPLAARRALRLAPWRPLGSAPP